jgi:quercetin dioxygenase-like cupin family protein
MKSYLLLRAFFVGLILLTPVSVLIAQEEIRDHQRHVELSPSELVWGDGPASLPKGAKAVLLEGDPAKPGPFTMRVKLPANYKIPPHWHPGIEHVTVLSGSFYMGLGEVFDESKARKLPSGGFAVMEIGTRHFAFTREASVVQLHGMGPWGITYVNAADDPRTKLSGR